LVSQGVFVTIFYIVVLYLAVSGLVVLWQIIRHGLGRTDAPPTSDETSGAPPSSNGTVSPK
jgi:hypothetical protein